MEIDEIIIGLCILSIPALFIWTAVSAMFQPAYPDSLKGERRKVEFEGEEFEFRFWVSEDFGWECCGVFAPRPPKKILWKMVNNDYCVAMTHNETDPVAWCYSQLEGFYAERCLIRKGEEKLKKWLADHPDPIDN